ncbi:MAG: translation initiation factor IF-2 [Ignavibacteria bacterium]|nr:translation initiation factor IF-2 [Ignavibacteria bacterium]OIO18891.1 MAG: translation initiation factor IF-2 [Ignavibacteria bacterium CG1_02_37_35]PIS46219.1 MAG: translation initiation factor IF-2 [Ignavibacteria bacterium CG08_land_8_20_14_0_20_37_9]PIX94288.1 MAG: translation initiation factor IF-2 [Ignavibacteria bacterium CG_4_10_14_3_um_filter_37_18]PJC59555.1 MAG: translation initiation factor IF-2 [Ignavibacteria bacterium CG_4_9_14_0_2_um_filter_37_13]
MEEEKSKKIRIYKLAAEYNLAADSIVEFLKKKGYTVKTHMTLVSDEMMADIQNHFKKDLEKVEKHQKKLAEFSKKMSDKAHKEKEVKIDEEPLPQHFEEVPKAEPVKELKPVVEEKPIEVEPAAKSKSQEKIVESTVPQAKSVKVKQVDKVETTPVAAPQTAEEPEVAVEEPTKRKGLTVLGKMDLRTGKEIISGQEVVKKTETAQTTIKKKKKKPKPKKKGEAAPEENIAAKKVKKVKKFEIDDKEVKDTIRKTLLSMDDAGASGRALSRKKKKREREELEIQKQESIALDKNKIKVTEFIAVSELANLMGVPVGDVISKCISLGLMVSINQRLEIDNITLVADEFGFEVEIAKEFTSEILEDTPDAAETLLFRSPVVTIMGHVDHGKTSLLDYIRRANVVAGEAGGITQHIGAYKVDVGSGKTISFLDTPGHEAFTAMRARGAQITDIVVLVVAADDAVMPQTIEAINHAQAANVSMIVAINKIDKPGANPERIKQQLSDRKILVEDWGGKYQCVELSAKTGKNVDVLLEKILLESEMLDLKANPNRAARGVIIESELDKGRGITATVLVQKGTLKIGDPFVAGIHHGRVRAMFDERNRKVQEATPSTPVLVIGMEGAPQAGDLFIAVESERAAREISIKRQQLKREQDQKQVHHVTLDEISRQISIGGVKELPMIVKGDVDGSVEALADSLMKLSREEVLVKVIHRGVGAISEGDVLLAAASNAIIIGFHVRPNLNARKLAENQKVDIRLYSIIYDAINEVKLALEGLLAPVISEEVTATVEIREVFKISKIGTVAGCRVQEGKIQRNNKVRLVRDGIVIFEGDILTLKRFKDDVRDVDAGFECGISLANYNDLKVGDIIEAYKVVETKKKFV